jgi:dynein heavy chain, axonemal
MHKSVSDESNKMFTELRRRNYVTPTNFLELTSGYKTLLYEKRIDLTNNINKLTSGLSKIIDTRAKVEQMSSGLEESRAKASGFQAECEDYLVVLVKQKREADEQAKVNFLISIYQSNKKKKQNKDTKPVF